MTISILVICIFLVAAVLMFFRKLPAMLALPLMAVAIVSVEIAFGRLTVNDLLTAVIADGALRLADPMIISLFGGMLSYYMQKTGVAESFVRRGAELSGDNPWIVAVCMLAMIALLFTTIGGLGAVIMVGTIVLPILASIGLREHVSAGIMLFGISLGGLLNATNWTIYKSVLGLKGEVVSSFALMVFAVVALVSLLFVTIELWRSRTIRLSGARVFSFLVGIVVVLMLALWSLSEMSEAFDITPLKTIAKSIVSVASLGIVVYALSDAVRARHSMDRPQVRWYAYLIPIVPLLLILVYDVPFVAAFMCGLMYALIATYRRGILNVTTRSLVEGSASVIPAVVLMIGIGMLLSAILGPTYTGPGQYWYDGDALREWPVLVDMKPLLETIVPESFLSYVLTFSLLGPLALYRGPLNVWGLGYGVGGILLATGVPAGAVMGILMSLGIIQGVSDPTNTANVWIANEVRLDVNTILRRTLPYSWLVAVGGLIVAGIRFF